VRCFRYEADGKTGASPAKLIYRSEIVSLSHHNALLLLLLQQQHNSYSVMNRLHEFGTCIF
jgi:hypothetical protein